MSNATARAASRKSAWHFGQDHGTAGMKERSYDFACSQSGVLIRQLAGTVSGPLTIPQARAEQQLGTELGLSPRTPATTSTLVAAAQTLIMTDDEAEAVYDQMVAELVADSSEASSEAWRLHCVEQTLAPEERTLFRQAQVARTSKKAFADFVEHTYSREELELIELIRQAVAEGEYHEAIVVEEIVVVDDILPFNEERAGYGDCPLGLARNWKIDQPEEDSRDYVPLHLSSR